MTHGSLFSGIGGFDYAAGMMGWRNAFHCEINEFCSRILKYHFPEARYYEDITKTDFTEWRGKIDVLTGGFPCQPFSVAGARKGADDDRYLWPQMLRAIREIRPTWVVGENVAGILTMVQPGEEVEVGNEASFFGEDYRKRVLLRQQFTVEAICQDIEREGYEVQPFVIPACAVGAPHRRDRVWFVARRNTSNPADTGDETLQCGRQDGVYSIEVASHPDLNRQRGRSNQQIPLTERQGTPHDSPCGQDGVTTHPDEHRSPSRAAGEGTERIRRRDIPQPCEWRDAPQRSDRFPGLSRDATYTRSIRRYESELYDGKSEKTQQEECGEQQFVGTDCPQSKWRNFPTQPPVCSRDDGFPIPMDGITFSEWRQEAIKAYGNAIVPQVAYEIFRAIEETYNNREK